MGMTMTSPPLLRKRREEVIATFPSGRHHGLLPAFLLEEERSMAMAILLHFPGEAGQRSWPLEDTNGPHNVSSLLSSCLAIKLTLTNRVVVVRRGRGVAWSESASMP